METNSHNMCCYRFELPSRCCQQCFSGGVGTSATWNSDGQEASLGASLCVLFWWNFGEVAAETQTICSYMFIFFLAETDHIALCNPGQKNGDLIWSVEKNLPKNPEVEGQGDAWGFSSPPVGFLPPGGRPRSWHQRAGAGGGTAMAAETSRLRGRRWGSSGVART